MANLTNSAKLIEEMNKKAYTQDLATVATTGAYSDLTGQPTIPTVNNSTIKIQKNSADVDSFTTNASSGKTINITMTKSDVGLGNVDNTSDANKPVSNATQTALNLKANSSDVYDKSTVDSLISGAISSVYKYKGSKANYDALPSSGNTTGDVWNVEAAHTTAPVFPAGSNVAWDGTAWDVLGGTVDLSNYVTLNSAQTISGTKTFSAEPVLPSKTTAATNSGTKPATEAQVKTVADAIPSAMTASELNTGTSTTGRTISAALLKAGITGAISARIDTTDYSSSWDGSTNAPTENAVYDKINTMDTTIGNKANTSDVLTKTNTTSFTPTGDYQPATKKYVDDNAGAVYNSGEGISIGDVTMNARKGPSPDGFHVPSNTEWQGVKTIMDGLSLTTGNSWKINLHMPLAGLRHNSTAALSSQGSYGYYWSSSPYESDRPDYARYLSLVSNVNANDSSKRAHGFSVRCFKNSYVTPDSSWTVIQGTLGNAGIFWNQSKGLISVTDGTTGYTMMDKNLGATTVYNNGDTLTQDNMGNIYQWGNNYGFPSTGTISNTSSTQVDASVYGPINPYSSNTFITGSDDWSSVHNDDLWGNTTGTITQENVISNTGVLSVNGQTGNVTVASPDMSNYLAKNNTTAFTPSGDYNPATKKYVDDNKGTKVELVTQAQYDNIGSEKLTNGVLYGIIES